MATSKESVIHKVLSLVREYKVFGWSCDFTTVAAQVLSEAFPVYSMTGVEDAS